MKAVLVEKGILVAGQKLGLNPATTKEGLPTDWMRFWNDDKRIAVSIAKDLVTSIQNGDEKANHLVLQAPETRTGNESGTDYTAYRIVAVQPAAVEL